MIIHTCFNYKAQLLGPDGTFNTFLAWHPSFAVRCFFFLSWSSHDASKKLVVVTLDGGGTNWSEIPLSLMLTLNI